MLRTRIGERCNTCRFTAKPKVEKPPKVEKRELIKDGDLRTRLYADGNVVKLTAGHFGVSASTIYSLMQRFGIEVSVPKKHTRAWLNCAECAKAFSVIRSRATTALFCGLVCSGIYTYRNTCTPKVAQGKMTLRVGGKPCA